MLVTSEYDYVFFAVTALAAAKQAISSHADVENMTALEVFSHNKFPCVFAMRFSAIAI